jgi:hypothetical protein
MNMLLPSIATSIQDVGKDDDDEENSDIEK